MDNHGGAPKCARCGRPLVAFEAPDIAAELARADDDESRARRRSRGTLMERLAEAEPTVGLSSPNEDVGGAKEDDQADTSPLTAVPGPSSRGELEVTDEELATTTAISPLPTEDEPGLAESSSPISSSSMMSARIPVSGDALAKTTAGGPNTDDEASVVDRMPAGDDDDAPRRSRATMIEALPALPRDSDSGDETVVQDSFDDTTVVATSVNDVGAQTLRIDLSESGLPIPDETSKTKPARSRTQPQPALVPPHRSKGGLVVLGVGITLIVAGVSVGIGLWQSQDTREDTAVKPPPGYRVRIPAGPYLRGLSNDFRLMFADACKKTADDPQTACKEEIALKDEYPQTTVQVAEFTIDAYEVTNADWAECVAAKRCSEPQWKECRNYTTKGLMPFLRVPAVLKEDARPVVCVSRSEAQVYCEFRSGRLPTSDEWEKAARGDHANLFPWGSDWDPELANWAEKDMMRTSIAGKLDGYASTAPVGSYEEGRSPHGVYDMAGNASEWVWDRDDDNQAIEAHARGGSWLSTPVELRATWAQRVPADERRTDIGIRCVGSP